MRIFYHRLVYLRVLLVVVAGLGAAPIAGVCQSLPGSGNSLTFDGSTTYISCGASNRGITSQVSVEAWIKTTSPDYQWIAGKYLNSNYEEKGFHLYTANGLAYLRGRIGQNAYLSSGASSTRVNDGRWHHLAGTTDGNTWRIYVDGVLENTTTNSFAAVDFTTTTALTIGNYAVQNGQYFQGDIDEVRVWRTVRTAAEIQQNMCRKFATAPAELVAYYRLDQTNGLTATDQGSQPTDGTLQGFTGSPWHPSGAALGDVSTSLYPASWPSGTQLSLAAASNEVATLSGVAAPAKGVQLYAVNSAPSIGAGAGASNAYFGVFTAAGGGNTTGYTLQVQSAGGTGCRTAQQRPANDATWNSLTPSSTTGTALTLGPLAYRGEYILLNTVLPPVAISGDSLLCGSAKGQLTATAAGATGYLWNTGATTATIGGLGPGTYSVTASFAGGCTQQASYRVRAGLAAPAFTLGADTTLCENETLTLRGPAGAGLRYEWSTGATSRELLVSSAGTYTLRVSTQCGTTQAARVISPRNCLVIPNIVTANGDAHNDVFAVQGLTGTDWSLDVFNRWGRSVLHTDNYRNDWGANAAPGMYYVLLRRASTGYQYKGWVEVVR